MNASSNIILTESGIYIDYIFSQSQKAELPI